MISSLENEAAPGVAAPAPAASPGDTAPTAPLPPTSQPAPLPQTTQTQTQAIRPPSAQPPAAAARGAAPDRAAARPPFRLALTILHLAAFGVIGFGLIGLLLGALGAGIGLLFVLGIGLVVLVGLVYALFGIAWFETQRVSGLYGLVAAPPPWRDRAGPGFKAWIGSVGRQSIDGRMWRALASFAISSLLGAGVLALAQWFVESIISMIGSASASSWWWLPGIPGAVVSAAGIVGFALLHRVITVAIVGSGAKEAVLAERAQVSAQQRAGAVRAADVERTRIERDLHDGVQPRLVSVAMTLGLAQQQIDTDPDSAKALIAEAHTSTKAAITELRQLARGIYASVLDDRGLDAALSALAARSHIPVQLDARLQQRCSRDAEAAVYFAIAESLTNAAKHSRASECRVVVRVRDDGMLWARVEDNGIGGASVSPGGGLDGVMNRVLAAGGSTRLDSPQGGPTALEVSVPCAS
ncbi:sensor histidine kinase [Leucobacter triazinivorans]|uniref:histidine kinase n=1 Tax=Leucobacter triazinivorans TaxID=1784719 RepID=A0A4V0Z1M4_9MICO|nr:histidine kinase [Leucobacter triazinivorans]QBE48919.1 sensor histidine kinase [Leucobacter triazinivorans]